MAEGRIVALYTPPLLRPRKFVIHRRPTLGPELFELHRFLSLKELVRSVLVQLSASRADFWDRILELDDQEFQKSRHKMRRYIADRKDLLYINSSHLTDQHSMKIQGYWIATNIGRKESTGIIGMACEAAGIKRQSLNELKL
jgi:hypothetical protein